MKNPGLALIRAAERQSRWLNRDGRRLSVVQRLASPPSWMTGPRWTARSGVPLVRIRCGACGQRVATVEEHGRALRVRSGHTLNTFLVGAVACERHGRLSATWEELEPKMAAARTTRRPATLPLCTA